MKSLILAALLLGACTTWKVPAYGTLTSMNVALEGAAKQLPDACEKAAMAEADASKDEAEATARAEQVMRRCDTAALGMLTSMHGLKSTRQVIKDSPRDKIEAKQITTWIKLAYDAYQALVPLLGTFGIKLPEIK
jgi:hypothetical protein